MADEILPSKPRVRRTPSTPRQSRYQSAPIQPPPDKPKPILAPHQIQFVLTILLLIAAFTIGVLYTKVQTYEKGAKSTESAATSGSKPTEAPGRPAVKTPQVTDEDHMRGNKNARVTLVEYSDLECPFCKTFHPTMQQVLKTYTDNVRWVYRHFPLSFHANAQKEAEASECAAELGGNDAFWTYIDKVFERTASNGKGFALENLAPLAAEIGLDRNAFQTCLDSGKYAQKIKDQMAKGSEEGITGTPGTIVVGKGQPQLIPGALPFEQVKTIIDIALK